MQEASQMGEKGLGRGVGMKIPHIVVGEVMHTQKL